jgi:hypothetical protein
MYPLLIICFDQTSMIGHERENVCISLLNDSMQLDNDRKFGNYYGFTFSILTH